MKGPTHRDSDPADMRRKAVVWCLLAVAFLPFAASAQQHDAPVRYEDDYLSAEFHRSRRDMLLRFLPENAVGVFFSAATRNRSNDVSFEYRQSSDFLYLTGSEEPGSVLVLAPGGIQVDDRTVREVLFVPPRNPSEEVWTGRRFGTERAMQELGLELAVELPRFDEVVVPLLRDRSRQVHHLEIPDGVASGSDLAEQLQTFLAHVEPWVLPRNSSVRLLAMTLGSGPDVFARLKEADLQPASFTDPELRQVAEEFAAARTYEEWAPRRTALLAGRSEGSTLRDLLDDLRSMKAPEEMVLLQRAIDITADAHRAVMTQVQPGWTEYQVEALIEYTFKREGSEFPGFPSIVGSGENSVILHYETNRRTIQPGDVVVVDIGAEYHGYTADITRTIPVGGRYSPEQRAIYELVYAAQESGIAASRAGAPFRSPHEASSRVLAEGLARLGLISSANDQAGLRRFFMHGTSHYLGLDVHDVGDGGNLVAGQVITVEPGIYIAASDDIDPKWWNVGVRIEDDVLITDGDPVILSSRVPRQIDEVEALMQRRPLS
ncbi:MAG: M24 family metallopeptidase [Gemmatimonadetes bacterium]|nr:M24 family metallopeptidase [Gemmatimonadota bacterium]